MLEKIRRERFRLRLLLASLVTVALLSGTFLVLREVTERQEHVSKVLDQRGRATVREYDALFRPVRNQLAVIRDWGIRGKLDVTRPENLDRILIPALDHQAWASEMILVPGNGTVYRLAEGADGWAGESLAQRTPPQPNSWYLKAMTGDPGELCWTSEGRPAAHWTAVCWEDSESTTGRGVVGVRVSTERVERTTSLSPVGEEGLVAIIGPEQQLFWHMRDHGPFLQPADLEDLLEAGAGPERLLAEAVIERLHGAAPDGEVFRFRDDDGEPWWGWWGEVAAVDRPRDLLLVAPESDLVTGLSAIAGPGSYVLLAFFFGCIALLTRSAFRFRNRLERMTRANLETRMSESDLKALIAGGEGDRVEFKSTMRWCLRSDEPRHEVELAWLKTVVAFLNTRGGTVLIGVADDGSVLGMEADRFKNDDRCLLYLNNRLQQNVGVEFLPFLRYALHPLGERSIVVLQVLPADHPAFLTDNGDDQFYVRMGPANRRLNLRQTFRYLEDFGKR